MKIDISKITNPMNLFLKQHGPDILVVLGSAGAVAGGVMACCATYKHLADVMDDHGARAESARENPEDKKAMTQVYLSTSGALCRLYAPALMVEALSITSILAGNNILRKQSVALAAAYAAVNQSFKDYRGRVVERFGAQVDSELRHNLHTEKIEETVEDENGKKKKVKREISVAGDAGSDDYKRIFAKGETRAAEGNPDYDLFYLRSQQELANHMLRSRGWLSLNDVYDMLGIDPCVAGQMVGWVYDKNDDTHGDNYIDFRIQDVYRKKDDGEGYEQVFLIDPNVDGSILNHAVAKGLMTK